MLSEINIRAFTLSFILFLIVPFNTLAAEKEGSQAEVNPTSEVQPAEDASSERYDFTREVIIPEIGLPTGMYTNDFSSSKKKNNPVRLADLPLRPYLGTEIYWIPQGENVDSMNARAWLKDLKLDFIRVENTASDLENGNDDKDPYTDFSGWKASDFEGGKGWNFNDTGTQSTHLINHYSEYVQFPLMMMMHYGGENYMNDPPDSEEYAEYFLATVYYNNVVKGRNIQYWEVLNEPDWGWKNKCDPQCYARIVKKVAGKIKNHSHPAVNSIRFGGAVQGSGDPIDGKWPSGYPNKINDGERRVRDYVPVMLDAGSRSGEQDVGLVTWHDYGEEKWGSNNPFRLDNTYVWYNRTNGFHRLAEKHAVSAAEVPLLGVSEYNFDAGGVSSRAKSLYKSFYANLWHSSTLNNYFATGKIHFISHFYWKGSDRWPKGLVYKDHDTGDKLVRNPVWWGYKEYIEHTAEYILASYPGTKDQWADAIVTIDTTGSLIHVIAVNKSEHTRTIDFSFDIPVSMSGKVWVNKKTMKKSGKGKYGTEFSEPTIESIYQFQPINLQNGNAVRYHSQIPAQTIVYYTLVKE